MFRSNFNKIPRRNPKNKSKDQLNAIKILKIFMSQEKMLENCIRVMLKLCLKLSAKQRMEKDLRYYFLKKCFKDDQ